LPKANTSIKFHHFGTGSQKIKPFITYNGHSASNGFSIHTSPFHKFKDMETLKLNKKLK
jgi:hypothetical protein